MFEPVSLESLLHERRRLAWVEGACSRQVWIPLDVRQMSYGRVFDIPNATVRVALAELQYHRAREG